jgi:hypothetical protein
MSQLKTRLIEKIGKDKVIMEKINYLNSMSHSFILLEYLRFAVDFDFQKRDMGIHFSGCSSEYLLVNETDIDILYAYFLDRLDNYSKTELMVSINHMIKLEDITREFIDDRR